MSKRALNGHWSQPQRAETSDFVLKQCAVRELNPQPADSDYSLVVSCRWLSKPLRHNEIRDSHHRTVVDSCRSLSSKDVAKSVCDDAPTLAWHGDRGGVLRLTAAQRAS